MKINPCLYLVDGDIFESKNLARQNCIEKDMGRNKAVVMAERYGRAMDFPVVAIPEMVNSEDNLYSKINVEAHAQGKRQLLTTRKLIIMCVDSIDARLKILNQVGPDDIIVDAGNEDTFGQVSIFDKISLPHLTDKGVQIDEVEPFAGEYELPFIPAPISQYLEALVNPPAATGSCAELDQSLAINNLMAAGIINMVQNLAYNNKFYCRTNYFDLIKGNTSERMTHTWFNQVAEEKEVHANNDITEWSYRKALNIANDSSNLDLDGWVRRDVLINAVVSDLKSKVSFIDPEILKALGK